MEELAGKVAVVTGAASGIGRALAQRFAAEGMKVILADIDEERLRKTAEGILASGGRALAVRTDVSRAADIEELRRRTLAAFGAVHLVCNNAGLVSRPAPSWEKRLEDWDLVLGVNLRGVIHGVRVFVPLLIAQGQEGHIVNTASAAGLLALPNGADYLASKHAVVSISESLQLELARLCPRVKVSVLCPGLVRTRILEASYERPPVVMVRPDLAAEEEKHRRLITEATSPEEIARAVVEAVRKERFWIFPHPEIMSEIEARFRCILAGKDPGSP